MAQAQARENIEIVEYMTMVDLISADNICGGVVAMDEQDEIYEISAPLRGACLRRTWGPV